MAVVMIQRCRLVEEVGHGQVEPAVAVEVSAGNAHSRQTTAASARRQARAQSLLGESAATVVVKEVVGRCIIGHEQVDLTVVVEIARDDSQAPSVAVDDTRFLGHVDEAAAVVTEDMVRQRREGARVAILIIRCFVPGGAQRVGLSASHCKLWQT